MNFPFSSGHTFQKYTDRPLSFLSSIFNQSFCMLIDEPEQRDMGEKVANMFCLQRPMPAHPLRSDH
jgi:hypothetical protein